jgi:hypothetical protein
MAKAPKQSNPVEPKKPAPPAPAAGGIIFMGQTRAGGWVEIRKPIAAPPGKPEGRLVAAARADLKKLYPHGATDDMSITQLQNELRVAREDQGRKGYSYDTVARALGRRN